MSLSGGQRVEGPKVRIQTGSTCDVNGFHGGQWNWIVNGELSELK